MDGTVGAKRGHWPTLLGCFLHFDLSFAIWVLIGALGIFVAEDLELGPAAKGWLIAIPILSGSLLRIPLGVLGDRIGTKRVAIALLLGLFVPLMLAWQRPPSIASMVVVGLLLGLGGASFAVVLPLASRHYPPHRQGLVNGVVAAGNSGTVIANLVAPALAGLYGWQAVFGLAMIPLALVLVGFSVLVGDDRRRLTSPRKTLRLAELGREPDLWWFCWFYFVTFGGYVGLSSFLPLLLRDEYGMQPVAAGFFTAAAALVGSASRPLGGHLADRLGAVRLLLGLLVAIGVGYGLATRELPREAMFGLVLGLMIALGLGNGAVFNLVPRRFGDRLGAATGIIGAVGGIGGFFCPMLLGLLKAESGSFAAGFAVLGGCALTGAALLRVLSMRFPQTWRWSPTSS